MKGSISLFLLFILLTPNLAQSFHVFAEHTDEYLCNETITHIHKKENICLLEYTFTNPFVDTYKKN